MKNIEAVGKITWLMGQSDQHCSWTVDDIHRLVLPPIALQQFRIWEVESQPVGFMTWGFFTDEVEQGYLTGERKIQPDDWQEGDQAYVVDFVAPNGGVREMVREGRDYLGNQYGPKVIFKGWRKQKGKSWSAST
jgi:cytolysin-activating lysine-acyltransferase|tara:strand:- start:1504 stop:1905 length:402 start_codon:yes stop_codon:yes gene_type:complete